VVPVLGATLVPPPETLPLEALPPPETLPPETLPALPETPPETLPEAVAEGEPEAEGEVVGTGVVTTATAEIEVVGMPSVVARLVVNDEGAVFNTAS